MQLFVWDNPYQVSYGHSLVFAIAESVEQARELAESKVAKWYSCGKHPNGFPGYTEDNKPNYTREGPRKLGEPTRVVDLPCAEWHEWEE